MSSKKDGIMYAGNTNDMARRSYEHREGLIAGFTRKYKIKRLAYVEVFDNVKEAVEREKQLKGWRRDEKISLIESENKDWNDLYGTIL
jgi:putative endonuclease